LQKELELWTIKDLQDRFARINFPEYQREPTVWSRAQKLRLIDSITRQFDIASIYLYKDEDGSLECVDGRQRLGAIMAFLGENPGDEDNAFEYKRMNEIYEDEEHPFAEVEGKRFGEINDRAKAGDSQSQHFLDVVFSYKIAIVSLSGVSRPEEFNLQFTRLNLGTMLNSGEKLHAMVGDLRDVCFNELGQHPFLQAVGIPTRRYAQEQVAAQLLGQLFSIAKTDEYARTRHFDLQRLFKEHADLADDYRKIVEQARTIMDLLHGALDDPAILKNRALTISAVLMAWKLGIKNEKSASQLAEFLSEFLCRLNWQLKKGLDFDPAYRRLIDFNRDVTQASVESYAVKRRTEFLIEHYLHWKETGKIREDEDYEGNPSRECREAGSPSNQGGRAE